MSTWSREPHLRGSREPQNDRSTSEEPSTSGRPFQRTPPNLQRPAADSAYNSQGRWLSKLPASRDSDRNQRPTRLQEDWSSGHLVSSMTALQREGTGSHSTFRATLAGQEHDRYAPLDLRQHNGLGDSPLARLRFKSGGQELSQGLTSLLNAPDNGGNAQQLGSLGAIWCWPFGSGPDLPQVVPPADPNVLPPIAMTDFQPYLASCAASQARFEAARRSRAAEEASSPMAATFGGGGAGPVGRIMPGEGLVEAMRTVPAMFFNEDFSLTRPETWREVLSTEDEGQRLARLEEYTGHLDTVESQLLREIAARSEHFFEASGVVQDLRASLHRTYSQVTSLRRQIGALRSEMQQAADNVTRSKRMHTNLAAVMDILKVVEEVASAQEAVELLLPQGDFAGALDVLNSLRATLSTHHTAGLNAFRHLPAQLADISEAVDNLLSSEFLRSTQFHEQPVVMARIAASLRADGAPSAQRIMAEFAAEVAGEGNDLDEELTPLILGLRRTGHLSATIRFMQAAAAQEVKAGIREAVEQGVMELLGEGHDGTSMSVKLQMLQPEQFICLLRCASEAAWASVLHVRRVQAAVESLLKTSKAGRGLAAAVGPEFTEVVQAVSEAAHSRWINLLAARSATVTALELSQLKELLDTSESFAQTMQEAGSRPVLALRNALQVQSKACLESMHHLALARLASLLEQEVWAVADVPLHCQRIVDDIFYRAGQQSNLPPGHTDDGHAENGGAAGDAAKLRVGGEEFSVVDSELLLLELLEKYLQFVDAVPSLAAEALHRVVELVKVFNSRMCQLVLGAGAMQVAGLKSITAKHLALSCQCLGALISLHPALVAAMGAHLPASRRALLTQELSLVLQDLTLHRGEVHSKLVGIMRERLISSLKQLPALAGRWGAAPTGNPQQPSSFSLNLVKQLRTLSQVLSPMLLEDELHVVFGRVAALYGKNLAEAFSRLEPLGPMWEMQVRADLDFLLAALRELPVAPAAREAALVRLTHLCETRFAPLADATPRGAPSRLSAASKDPPASGGRLSLVSRLGHAKLPFFKHGSDDGSKDTAASEAPATAQPDSNGSAQQQEDRLNSLQSSESLAEARMESQAVPVDNTDLEASIEVAAAGDTNGTIDSVAEPLSSSRAQDSMPKELAESPRDLAGDGFEQQAIGSGSRMNSFGDNLEATQPATASPPVNPAGKALGETAAHATQQESNMPAMQMSAGFGESEPHAATQITFDSPAAVEATSAFMRAGVAAEAAATAALASEAEDPQDNSLAAQDSWLGNRDTSIIGDGQDMHNDVAGKSQGAAALEQARPHSAGNWQDQQGQNSVEEAVSSSSSLAIADSRIEERTDAEQTEGQKPAGNPALAIEQMLKSVQREDWEQNGVANEPYRD